MKRTDFTAADDDHGRRLDRVLKRLLPDLPLSAIYRGLRRGEIKRNNNKASQSDLINSGDCIQIADVLLPANSTRDQVPVIGESGNRPFSVILCTPDLFFINKPTGYSIQGRNDLTPLVLPLIKAEKSLSFRPGPLHRLDMHTTGIVCYSASLRGARWFSSALAEHRLEKYYLGVAEGSLDGPMDWQDRDKDGILSHTAIFPLARTVRGSTPISLIQYRILTGRKHQIRKQGADHGLPLFGDRLYNPRSAGSRYYLHAWQLHFPYLPDFPLPKSVRAPLPDAFIRLIRTEFGQDVLATIDTGHVY